MDAAAWSRVRSLFDQLVDLPQPERSARIEASCGDDPAVYEVLERLLAADGRTIPWPHPPPSLEVRTDAPRLGLVPGQRIGAYTLRELIATGGMGAVWLAEQTQPRRVVALKTLRWDLAGSEALKRFRAEAELIAHLRHPGIAQVFDAGSCIVDGRAVPYLVMEYIEGSRNLLDAAEASGLDRAARLRLFAAVCDAVHHGHQRGVIHRDLKPANVLVDAEGRPKVIDFGLARALDPDMLAVSLVRTRPGEIFGTPAYMSPEQVRGDPIEVDVRSDVYALGCILCELLTGRPPLDLGGRPLPEAVRRIAEEPVRLPTALPLELRWVLAKALDKDPDRRYPSASELAADVRRALSAQPVMAGPPSSLYELRRFARRHSMLLLAGLAVVVALTIGMLQARTEARAAERARAEALAAGARAQAARDQAEQQAALASTTSYFLSDLFLASSIYEKGRDALVTDAIAVAESGLDTIEHPIARAILTSLVGQAHMAVEDRQRGAPMVRQSVDVLREALPPQDRFRLMAEAVLADLLEQDQRFAESRALSEELLPLVEANLGPDHRTTLYLRFNLAVCCYRLGEPGHAEELFLQNLKRWETRDARDPNANARRDLLQWIGNCRIAQGRVEEGLESLEQALELARSLPQASLVVEAALRMDIASAWRRLGDPELALAELEQAAALYEQAPPSATHRFAIALNLAGCLRALGRLEEAETQAARAADALREGWTTPGLRHVLLLRERTQIAVERGDLELAESRAREALALALDHLPRAHSVPARLALARVLLARARPVEAAGEAQAACADLPGLEGGSSEELAAGLELLARAHLAAGEPERAAQAARESVERTPPDSGALEQRRTLRAQAESALSATTTR